MKKKQYTEPLQTLAFKILGLKQNGIFQHEREMLHKTFQKLKIINPPSSLLALENEEEAVSLRGQGIKIINPSNFFDIYTKLQVLLGL